MAGKSTFLRTVGINAVLALAGAPVCASRMEISGLQMFTSMRTQDSLEESVSSFYAELQRLKQLLETVARGAPVFFMLDEILKGTNLPRPPPGRGFSYKTAKPVKFYGPGFYPRPGTGATGRHHAQYQKL